MDIVNVPLGPDVSLEASVSGGKIIFTVSILAKPEVDAVLDAAKAKLPAALAPLVDIVKAAADAALGNN